MIICWQRWSENERAYGKLWQGPWNKVRGHTLSLRTFSRLALVLISFENLIPNSTGIFPYGCWQIHVHIHQCTSVYIGVKSKLFILCTSFSNVLSTIDIVVVFESVNTTWLNMAEKNKQHNAMQGKLFIHCNCSQIAKNLCYHFV